MSLTLLTPTGGRPEAFSLLEKYIARQTYSGDIQWLVADDVEPPTSLHLKQQVLRPAPLWQPGENTQRRNLLSLLPLIRHDKILIIEDDDYLSPGYLSAMDERLDKAALVGETNSFYYNILHCSYLCCNNTTHACLFQTGMRGELLPQLTAVLQSGDRLIDVRLFRSARQHASLYPPSGLSLGIKGMPGRKGIGIGHSGSGPCWSSDPSLSVLRAWIRDDVELYRPYCRKSREMAA